MKINITHSISRCGFSFEGRYYLVILYFCNGVLLSKKIEKKLQERFSLSFIHIPFTGRAVSQESPKIAKIVEIRPDNNKLFWHSESNQVTKCTEKSGAGSKIERRGRRRGLRTKIRDGQFQNHNKLSTLKITATIDCFKKVDYRVLKGFIFCKEGVYFFHSEKLGQAR